ncbi:MAG: PKD domain-containing protein [Bacteroidaceae bacterium]
MIKKFAMFRIFLVLAFSLSCVLSMAQSQHVTVVEYHPAPGQFVNVLPEYTEGMTHEQMCVLATETLQEEGLVHLGSFGGYMTIRFDHPVQNKRGSDVRITGNSYYAQSDPVYGKETLGGSFEPGVVYVGVGEDVATCQWYELAGSEYYTTEQHSFTVTYYKPEAETGEHILPYSSFDKYLKWEASWTDADGTSRDSSGYHMKVASHQQSFWPAWEKEDKLTFTGGRLPDNAVDYSGNGTMWTLYRYAKDAYGYVDASLNSDDYSTFDIDWAVDSQGRHVDLEEIHYIRVVTGLFQHCGWIGESSTEVSGFLDLHLTEGYDSNPIVIPTRPLPSGIASHPSASTVDACFDLLGRQVLCPGKGIYIRNGKKYVGE